MLPGKRLASTLHVRSSGHLEIFRHKYTRDPLSLKISGPYIGFWSLKA